MIDPALLDFKTLVLYALMTLGGAWAVAICINSIIQNRRDFRRWKAEDEAMRKLLEPTPPCDAEEHIRRLTESSYDHTN
jgi:hypothetical protein